MNYIRVTNTLQKWWIMKKAIEKNMNEETVFAQELSDDELDAVNGGGGNVVTLCGMNGSTCEGNAYDNCSHNYKRYIYNGGFPNCAATVESSSWCGDNDACFTGDVRYQGMKNCWKAWE